MSAVLVSVFFVLVLVFCLLVLAYRWCIYMSAVLVSAFFVLVRARYAGTQTHTRTPTRACILVLECTFFFDSFYLF